MLSPCHVAKCNNKMKLATIFQYIIYPELLFLLTELEPDHILLIFICWYTKKFLTTLFPPFSQCYCDQMEKRAALCDLLLLLYH